MSDLDWEHLATFVAVARGGSLTAAARETGISQPTAGRHVQALEEALGLTLFVRHGRGLALTAEGESLFADAREVADRVDALLRRARGAGEGPLAGSVRISAAEPIGVHVIGPAIAELRARHRGVAIELVIDNGPSNLSRREVDLAVRMFRPTQLDLVARRIGEVPIGLFATRRYLRRHGKPASLTDTAGHTFIGCDRDPQWLSAIAALGVSAGDFAYRSDNLLAQIQAVRDGVGIGPMHLAMAAHDRKLVRVLPEVEIGALEMWLVMHRDLRGNRAVRAVFEHLAGALTEYVLRADGPSGRRAARPTAE